MICIFFDRKFNENLYASKNFEIRPRNFTCICSLMCSTSFGIIYNGLKPLPVYFRFISGSMPVSLKLSAVNN